MCIRSCDCSWIWDAFSSATVFRKTSVLSVRSFCYLITCRLRIFKDLYVPPEQVIDTVDLYFIKHRQRRLSLRFLTWFLLKENIQEDTHDSIEDARCALMLYKAYQKFEEQGVFDEKLEELYREGKQHVSSFSSITENFFNFDPFKNWKPPVSATHANSATTVAGINAPRPFAPTPYGITNAAPVQSPYSPTLYPTNQPTPPIQSINPFANTVLPPHRFANFTHQQHQWNRGSRR